MGDIDIKFGVYHGSLHYIKLQKESNEQIKLIGDQHTQDSQLLWNGETWFARNSDVILELKLEMVKPAPVI